MISNLRALSEELLGQTLSCSTREMLQHLTKSSRIPAFKKKVSLEEMKAHKEDRFFRGRQIAYLIYEQFRVTSTDDSVENYTDLFTIVLRNDDIQECDSKWDEILLSMTQIPSVDILESLYKLRIRESEKPRPYWNCYIWRFIRRKLDLIITDWKTVWYKEVSSRICE